jgi:hypothetical protein
MLTWHFHWYYQLTLEHDTTGKQYALNWTARVWFPTDVLGFFSLTPYQVWLWCPVNLLSKW